MTFESANANLFAALFMFCLGLVLLGGIGLLLARWMREDSNE